MDELHESLDKLFAEVEHLDRISTLVESGATDVNLQLALAQAKRVRRGSNLVVRALARIRDQL